MATILEACKITSAYSENLLNKASMFNDAFTANTASGAGSGVVSLTKAFQGTGSLKLTNSSNTVPLVVNAGGTAWKTTIPATITGSEYHFSFSVFNPLSYDFTGSVLIYSGGTHMYTIEFTAQSVAVTGMWTTFYQTFNLPALDVDFAFVLNHHASVFSQVHIDGMCLQASDKESIPAVFSRYVGNAYESSATLNFPSIATGAQSALTATLTGAREYDTVELSLSYVAIASGLNFRAYVSANDTIKIVAINNTGAAVDLAADTFKFKIVK